MLDRCSCHLGQSTEADYRYHDFGDSVMNIQAISARGAHLGRKVLTIRSYGVLHASRVGHLLKNCFAPRQLTVCYQAVSCAGYEQDKVEAGGVEPPSESHPWTFLRA